MSDVIKIKWKPFPYEPFQDNYEISNLGLVRSVLTGNIIKRSIRSGYLSVNLSVTKDGKKIKKAKKIHRMVTLAFIKNDDPEKKTWVNHINGDKFDCSVINLEWITPPGNAQHAADNGLVTKTKRAVIQYNLKTGKEINRYESILAASKDLNISDSSICNVCSGKKEHIGGFGWKYADNNPNQTTDVDLSKYKQIVVFPNYLLNDEGKIYSLAYKKFLKFQNHQEGGSYVQLTNGGKQKDFFVHRLVGMHFLKKDNPKYNSIRHIDGDKTNNHVNNLKWCYVGGVEMLESRRDTPYYNPKTAIKPIKRKSPKSGPKDLLTANPKNLSKKQRVERKNLLAKKSGSKTVKKKVSKKLNSNKIIDV